MCHRIMCQGHPPKSRYPAAPFVPQVLPQPIHPQLIEVPRVPQDDCGDEEVQARSAVLLVLVGAVADLAEAMDEDSPRQAVACFALVEFPAGISSQWARMSAVLMRPAISGSSDG